MELLRLIYLFQTLSLTGFFCYGLVRHASLRIVTHLINSFLKKVYYVNGADSGLISARVISSHVNSRSEIVRRTS